MVIEGAGVVIVDHTADPPLLGKEDSPGLVNDDPDQEEDRGREVI